MAYDCASESDGLGAEEYLTDSARYGMKGRAATWAINSAELSDFDRAKTLLRYAKGSECPNTISDIEKAIATTCALESSYIEEIEGKIYSLERSHLAQVREAEVLRKAEEKERAERARFAALEQKKIEKKAGKKEGEAKKVLGWTSKVHWQLT